MMVTGLDAKVRVRLSNVCAVGYVTIFPATWVSNAVLSAEQVLASPHFLVGTVDQMVADLQMRRERYEIFAAAQHDRLLVWEIILLRAFKFSLHLCAFAPPR